MTIEKKLKPCKTCPFLKGTDNLGSSEWLLDVVDGFKRGVLEHTCHCADPKADGFVGANRTMCYGLVGMMFNSWKFVVPKACLLDAEDIDASDCFKDLKDFVLHHLKAIQNFEKDGG